MGVKHDPKTQVGVKIDPRIVNPGLRQLAFWKYKIN